jgi:protein-disulfide isomerase
MAEDKERDDEQEERGDDQQDGDENDAEQEEQGDDQQDDGEDDGGDPEREKAIREGKDDAARKAEGLEEDESEDEDEEDDDRSDKDDDSTGRRKDDDSRTDERDDSDRREDADDEDEDEDEDDGGGRKRWKLLVIALAGAAIVVIAAILISSGGEEEKPPTTTTQREGVEGPIIGAASVNRRYEGIPQDGFELGERKADATIVEFADLQCPFCKEATENSLPPLVDRYIKPGRLRMEFRNFAILGPDSEKAAKALEAAAAQDKAWQFIELFYLNQGEENSGYVTDDFIRRIGKAIPGMDVERLVVASNAEGSGQSIEAAHSEADEFGIDSTPSYLIGRTGGQLAQLQLTNPGDVTQYTQAVDQLLAGE